MHFEIQWKDEWKDTYELDWICPFCKEWEVELDQIQQYQPFLVFTRLLD